MGATVKEERIEVRLASAEKDRIRRAAILSPQNLSEFVLRAVRTVADETLAAQTRFVLPEEQMNGFDAVLDQPAKSSATRQDQAAAGKSPHSIHQ